jgi:hypothetical protein
LWRQGGFPNLRAYRVQQSERLGMPSATISARRRCAEAWIDHRKDLRNIPLEGRVSKLRYFNQALRLCGDKKETLKHFREDSNKEFAAWSRPRKSNELPEVTATIKAGVLLIDGEPVARFSESLPKEEREAILSLVKKAYSARKGGLVPYVIPVYNAGEGLAVERLLKKYRAGK